MPTTVSTPVLAYSAALLALASGGVAQSSTILVSINNTGGWEVRIPVQVRYSNVSADATIYIYPSRDGGATYDTDPMTAWSIPRAQGTTRQVSASFPTGQYLIAIVNSGPNSASFAVNTLEYITAVQNV